MPEPPEVFSRFCQAWAFGTSRVPNEEELAGIESHFKMALPATYRAFVLTHGLVYTPDLLDGIVNANVEMPDVQNFLSPKEVVEATDGYVSAGMPAGFVGFASDCMGNLFCFNLNECQTPACPDAPVWFFDHDFVETECISGSFVEWLGRFLTVPQEHGV